MGTVSQQKAKKEIKKVDRLGRAVVSFIFSFIGLASSVYSIWQWKQIKATIQMETE